MTPAELAMALDEPDHSSGGRRPPTGSEQIDPHDVADYAARWRALTPRQRLERARRR